MGNGAESSLKRPQRKITKKASLTNQRRLLKKEVRNTACCK